MTDLELWKLVLEGDAKSWGELVRRYQNLVYAVCTRSGLSLADAADCFQQTWLLLYKSRRKMRDPSRLSAWLVTTAKRESLRLLRRASQDALTSAAETSGAIGPESRIAGMPDPDPLPDEELERLERQAQLEIALAELDPRCRKVLHEFFFAPEDKSYEQIARSLRVAVNTLGPLRRRCLERLKRILLKNLEEGERNEK